MSMPIDTKTYRLSCHCQENVFELSLPLPSPSLGHGTPFDDNGVCDCSHCVKRRVVWYFVPRDAVKVIRGGESHLKEYRFGAKRDGHKVGGDEVQADPIPVLRDLWDLFTWDVYRWRGWRGRGQCESTWKAAVDSDQLRTVRNRDFDLWALPLTQYSGINRDPPYSPPTLPQGADAYLARRAQHYNYPTKVYIGSCHCKAVTFGVLCKPLEDVLIMDCSCSMCLGNGCLWVYPGRHDIFFYPSSSTPWNPDPLLVTRYTFNEAKNETKNETNNEHVFCNKCGCQLFEAREAKQDDDTFSGWEEDNGKQRSLGVNVALINGIGEYLADGLGTGLKGLKRNLGERWKEPLYDLKA